MSFTYSVLSTGQIERSDGATIPVEPKNADYREYLKWVAAGNTAPVLPEPPPALVVLTKVQIYSRMTDAELAILDNYTRNQAPIRQRMYWEDAVEIYVSPDLMQLAVALFGAQRAAVILAPLEA